MAIITVVTAHKKALLCNISCSTAFKQAATVEQRLKSLQTYQMVWKMVTALVIAVEDNPDSSCSFAKTCHTLSCFDKGHCHPSDHRSLPSCRLALLSGTDSSSFVIRDSSCSYCLHNLPSCYSELAAAELS